MADMAEDDDKLKKYVFSDNLAVPDIDKQLNNIR